MRDLLSRTRWRPAALGVAGVIAAFAIWQWYATAAPLRGIPEAWATLQYGVALAGQPPFWAGVWTSLWCALLSLLIAFVIGVGLGLVTGRSPIAHAIVEPTTVLLRPIPPVVLLPLVLLVVGPTVQLAVAIAAFGAVWPIYVQAQAGVRAVSEVALDTARSLGLSWWSTQRYVVLPSAIPFIATGTRISASLSVMLVIGAGILGGSPGLGLDITLAQQAAIPERVFGMVLWAGLFGLVINGVLSMVERRIVRAWARPVS